MVKLAGRGVVARERRANRKTAKENKSGEGAQGRLVEQGLQTSGEGLPSALRKADPLRVNVKPRTRFTGGE